MKSRSTERSSSDLVVSVVCQLLSFSVTLVGFSNSLILELVGFNGKFVSLGFSVLEGLASSHLSGDSSSSSSSLGLLFGKSLVDGGDIGNDRLGRSCDDGDGGSVGRLERDFFGGLGVLGDESGRVGTGNGGVGSSCDSNSSDNGGGSSGDWASAKRT